MADVSNAQPGQAAVENVNPGVTAGAATVPGEQAQAGNQPLVFNSREEFRAAVLEEMNSVKSDWMDESFRNVQRMNESFRNKVNQRLKALDEMGIKATPEQVQKLVSREEQEGKAAAAQQPQKPNVNPGYQQFLNRFGLGENAVNDVRLQDAYYLEQEYGVTLETGDPEYQNHFADPNKDFGNGFRFQREYEKALNEKKARTAEAQTAPNAAAVPSLSGGTGRSSGFDPKAKSEDLIARGMSEHEQRRR